MVTKEIFLEGCRFVHKENEYQFWSIPNIGKKNQHCLGDGKGHYFANVSKIDNSGFNFYTFFLGKRFGARVLFKDLILLERKKSPVEHEPVGHPIKY